MPMVACRECGNKVSDYAKVCPKCGAKPTKGESIYMEWDPYRCEKCDTLITKKADNCPNCGESQTGRNNLQAVLYAMVPVVFVIWYLFFR